MYSFRGFILSALFLTIAFPLCAAATKNFQALEYASAPIDNPLKGLVPYAGAGNGLFPHSMEFSYLPLSAVVVDEKKYDWSALEKLLDPVASRGHQTIVRFYLEYPNKPSGAPVYLIEGGLKLHTWEHHAEKNKTPDYNDLRLRSCLKDFIAELGARYDNDPRIGFITAGLLGKWGEWHNYPKSELWASKTVQDEVISAYEQSFHKIPVLLRYPAADDDYGLTSNMDRKLGYHDDSFAWATLDTGKKGDEWFFMTQMKRAGALNKWRHHPIGGEIRPEAWGQVFDHPPQNKRIQDFAQCVEQSHVTWLMDSGMFSKKHWTQERHNEALIQVARMGYEFHISKVGIAQEKQRLNVSIQIENRGVAPFYHDWPIRLALLPVTGKSEVQFQSETTLQGILPNQPSSVWNESIDLSGIESGQHHVLLQCPNPLPTGNPVRFANKEQGRHQAGWLTLDTVTIK